MPDKYQILLEALNKIASILPHDKRTGRVIAQKALRQFREIETTEETKITPQKLSTLDKCKSLPCSCNRLICKDVCCGQCGCVPCFLSGREAGKTGNPANDAATNSNNAA